MAVRACMVLGTLLVVVVALSVRIGTELEPRRRVVQNFTTVPIWRRDDEEDDTLPQAIMEALLEGTPVVLRGALKSWPAMSLWTSESLGERLRTCHPDQRLLLQTTVIEQDGGKGAIWSVPVQAFVDYLAGRRQGSKARNLYISEWEDIDEECPDILEDVMGMWPFTDSLPWGPMLPFSNFIFDASGGRLDIGEMTGMDSPLYPALWWGPGGVRTGLHYDTEQFNLLCQVRGRKNVTFMSPAQTPHLYMNDVWDQSAGISRVNMWDVDEKQYPRFRDAVRAHVVIEPGDVLVVPAYWWHAVESLTESISVSARVDNTRVTELWDSVLNKLHKLGLYKNCKGCCTCHRDVEFLDYIAPDA